MFVNETSESLYHSSTHDEIHDMFLNTQARPSPEQMTSLILRGATEDDLRQGWLELGGQIPSMDRMLHELDFTLPFIQRISDVLAGDNVNQAMHIIAGRDGEAIYDDLAITHSDQRSVLLPASTPIWKSSAARFKPSVARGFLKSHGITPELVADSESEFNVVDTGFHGSIGQYIGKTLSRFFVGGSRVRRQGRLTTKLVHANPDGHGENIMEIEPFDAADNLPRTRTWLDGGIEKYQPQHSTAALAISLQLHPRHHGMYKYLEARADGVFAIPDEREIFVANLDHHWSGESDENNSSIVHPLASAILQRRIVLAALERSGQLSDKCIGT